MPEGPTSNMVVVKEGNGVHPPDGSLEVALVGLWVIIRDARKRRGMSKKNKRRGRPSGLCVYCAINPAEHWDHVIPKSRGGLDKSFNIVPACQPCNASKYTKTPSEWLDTIIKRVTFHDTPCQGSCRCCELVRERPAMLPPNPPDQQRAVLSRWVAVLEIERRAVVDSDLYTLDT